MVAAYGARGRLALADLGDDAHVHRLELWKACHACNQVCLAHARADLQLLLRRRIEQAEIVHHEERQMDAKTRQIAVPPQRAHHEHGRQRADLREQQATEGADDRGFLRERGGDGHELRLP